MAEGIVVVGLLCLAGAWRFDDVAAVVVAAAPAMILAAALPRAQKNRPRV